MRQIDMTPLYRATVGFDRFADLVDRVLTNALSAQTGYPPFNIEKTDDDSYRITLAAAGFTEDDLSVEVRENTLVIAAQKADSDQARTYLHRGIAERAFEKRFHLADHVRVEGARLENGILEVALKREIPEALKPRRIEISGPKTLNVKAVEKKKSAA